MRNLCSEDEFSILWDTVTASTKDTPVPAKWSRQVNKNLSKYVVEETSMINWSYTGCTSVLWIHILGELEVHFSERNSKFATALAALDPEIRPF